MVKMHGGTTLNPRYCLSRKKHTPVITLWLVAWTDGWMDAGYIVTAWLEWLIEMNSARLGHLLLLVGVETIL
jgi:hypothetical protein